MMEFSRLAKNKKEKEKEKEKGKGEDDDKSADEESTKWVRGANEGGSVGDGRAAIEGLSQRMDLFTCRYNKEMKKIKRELKKY